MPTGYGLGIIGLALFGAAGVADAIWHEIFGVEVGLDTFFSPTHIVLFAGGILILTTPLRSRWSAPDRGTVATAVGTVSIALAATMTAVMTLALSPFIYPRARLDFDILPLNDPGQDAANLPAAAGYAGYIVYTMLLLVPLLILASRFRLGLGSVTAITVAVSWPFLPVVAFRGYAVSGTLGATVGAVVADVLAGTVIARLLAGSGAWRWSAAAGGVPLLVWSGHLLGLAAGGGVGWPFQLASGVVVTTALLGAVVGLVPTLRPLPAPAPVLAGDRGTVHAVGTT